MNLFFTSFLSLKLMYDSCPLCETDALPSDPVQQQYNFWLSLVDKLGVKAFVDLTLSPSVRQGTQHLLRITGLGKPFPSFPVSCILHNVLCSRSLSDFSFFHFFKAA